MHNELRTFTPWDGKTINSVYLPSVKEIYSRAEEMREQRPRDRNRGPLLPDELFVDVIESAEQGLQRKLVEVAIENNPKIADELAN